KATLRLSNITIRRAGRRPGMPVLLLLCGLGVLACGCSKTAQVNAAASAPEAAVVKAARRNLSDSLEIASEFEPYQQIEVYAKVSGYIQKLDVDWGTHVKQGQLLAVLEVPELEQQLQQDDASVHRAENDLEHAREELKRAQAAYNVAHLTYSRL